MGYRVPEVVSEAVKKFDAAKNAYHDQFVRVFERRERAYRGILATNSNAAKWRHKYHPPYAFNLIETIVSNTVEMGLRFNARPSPHVNVDIQEAMQMVNQAEVMEDLLRHEHRIDEMEYKQRPLFLSAAIGGIGVGKCYWNYQTGPVKKQGVAMQTYEHEQSGQQLQVPVVTEIEQTNALIRDHSCFEVIDPRDFVLHESAKSLNPFEPGGAQYVVNRCWYSFEQLKMMEAAGYFVNVDELKNTPDFTGEEANRERSLWNINRTKDLIEVLEYWFLKDGLIWRAIIGNRAILLRDKEPNPFNHGGYPFIIASSMPALFSTQGVSDMELIEQLQEMLWELASQRFDNIELINNVITLIRSDVDDPDAFEYYPGARWGVDSVDQVAPFQPPYQLAGVTMDAEALIKTDLQNVTSAAPFAGGTMGANANTSSTATGASIVMNAAQQRLAMKKYEAQKGLKQEASMRLKNCQQFIKGNRLIHILGPDGAIMFKQISPVNIQGDFVVELEPMGESQMRQEKRAEALQLGQVIMGWAPLMAAAGKPIATDEVIRWVLKKWDVDDGERFLSVQPAAAGAQAAGQPGGPGGQQGGPPGAPEGPNMGTTSSTAVDASKPSGTGGLSMSPTYMLSRALALGGGVTGGKEFIGG